jgi:hypothetical protein
LLVAISFKVIVNGSPTNVTLDEMKAIVEEAQIEGSKLEHARCVMKGGVVVKNDK